MRAIRQVVPALPVFFLTAFAAFPQVGFEFHGLQAFRFDGETAVLGDHRVRDRMGAGASFFFSFIPEVRVEAGCDWIETRDRDLGDSKLRIAPLTAALRGGYNFGPLYLYLGGGAGYTLGKLYPSREAYQEWAEIGRYEPGLDNSPIYFALAGAEVVLSERWGIRVEYRYNWLRTKFTYQDWRGFQEKEKINLDHQQVRAGLAVYF